MSGYLESAVNLLRNDSLTFRKLFLPFSFTHPTNRNSFLFQYPFPLIALDTGTFSYLSTHSTRNCSADYQHRRTDVAAHAHNHAGVQPSSATTLRPLRCAPVSKTQSNLIVQSAALQIQVLAAQCRRPLGTMRLDCFA